MKKIKFAVITSIVLAAAILASCSGSTYAQKRKEEKAAIANYISGRNITVSTDSLKCDTLQAPWPENFFFKTYRGAYVRITKRNLDNRKAETGNTCVMRFLSYKLDGTKVGDNTNPKESREGTFFVYTHCGTSPCVGWNDAIPFMRHNGECEMIIESPIGPSEQQSEVIPLRIEIVSYTVSNNN